MLKIILSAAIATSFSMNAFAKNYEITKPGSKVIAVISGLEVASDQVVSSSEKEKGQLIFWQELKPGSKSFYFCEDRADRYSCRMIGYRGYANSELKEAAAVMAKAALDDRNVAYGAFATAAVLLTATVFVVPPGPNLATGIMGMASLKGAAEKLHVAKVSEATVKYLSSQAYEGKVSLSELESVLQTTFNKIPSNYVEESLGLRQP